MPVCSNGHFVCLTCRDRIRQEARLADGVEREPKCPSCMVDLGNATSLLASRLVERLKHECEQDGCEEKIPFAQLERHQLVCLFRKVLCPGSNCKLQIPFNKMEEHANSCGKIGIVLNMDNNILDQYLATNKKDSGDFLTWPTVSFEAHGKLFFVNTKRTKKHIYMFETILLGSEEECKGYLASISILDKDSNIFTANISHPRPISMEKWGDMGLNLAEKSLARIWTPTEDERYNYKIETSIKKV